MFIDRVEIKIKAGNGGNGHTSFLRDKNTQRGGPNGGDGGKGGDIVFIGSTRADNLIDFRYNHEFKAEDGINGRPMNKSGSNGKDLEIHVPLGTKVLNMDGGLLADIVEKDQKYLALRGGGGGQGNAKYATARRQTPNFSQHGITTAMHTVVLELNCIADVGLVGFPNVGKSSLLSIVSRANPKIGNYPFTTLHPNIGVYSKGSQTIIFADIPGLIEGASNGVGLGIDFLKHINRTRLLVHIIEEESQIQIIKKELENFSSDLVKRPRILVQNKIDVNEKIKGCDFYISCATREGIDELMNHIAKQVSLLPKPNESQTTAILEVAIDKNKFEVFVDAEGVYTATGPMIDNLIRGVVLSDTESAAYFHRRLDKSGVIEALKNLGMIDGDTVQVADTQFIWRD
ncbi:MAG: GTPase ObgE [Christensenellaceae bacterium]|jgi:GTP-binding protein|nr:GTPase ObgE [Christensenellaceae bacterium]